MSAILPAVRSAVGIAVGRAVRRLRAVSDEIPAGALLDEASLEILDESGANISEE